MDLREKKTKRSITNAFLQLRKTKELERITIKELTELAEISKATFYLHYKDIYDLSASLQNETIQMILSGLSHPESFLTKPSEITQELFHQFFAHRTLIDILFSGTQAPILTYLLEKELKKLLHEQNPQISIHYDILLTYQIQGAQAVYQQYHNDCDQEHLIQLVSTISDTIMNSIKPDSMFS